MCGTEADMQGRIRGRAGEKAAAARGQAAAEERRLATHKQATPAFRAAPGSRGIPPAREERLEVGPTPEEAHGAPHLAGSSASSRGFRNEARREGNPANAG